MPFQWPFGKKRVLVIGFDVTKIDFNSPEWKPLGLNGDVLLKQQDELAKELVRLNYRPELCFVDLGQTAEKVTAQCLRKHRYSVVVIGAGIRKNPNYFLLFEKIVNLAHRLAPHTPIAFNNTVPDTVDAIQRWISPSRVDTD